MRPEHCRTGGKIPVCVMGRFTMQPEHRSTGCSKVKRAALAIAAGGGRILVWRNEELYDAA
ncbi:hypothetical protein [uncultured Pluralibacter sp.]|uniref:hypothetical protein n=1 Tax=uncultured Pluralibacter sp. TaxID=1490864 RepID=UPI002604E683|nr:hypothetical protein [uncultured Pluralibacter sp.]